MTPLAPLPLAELNRRLRDARASVGQHRLGPAGSVDMSDARQGLLLALEAYIAGLEGRRLPVPYLLRDELRLARKLFRANGSWH